MVDVNRRVSVHARMLFVHHIFFPHCLILLFPISFSQKIVPIWNHSFFSLRFVQFTSCSSSSNVLQRFSLLWQKITTNTHTNRVKESEKKKTDIMKLVFVSPLVFLKACAQRIFLVVSGWCVVPHMYTKPFAYYPLCRIEI